MSMSAKILLPAATALVMAASLMTTPAMAAQSKSAAFVAIKASPAQLSKGKVLAMIKAQARAQGVHLSRRAASRAAGSAMNKLQANGNGPQKGVVHVKIRNISVCVSWGRDRDYCGRAKSRAVGAAKGLKMAR